MACGGARGPGPSPRDEQRRHPLERHRQHRRRGPAPEAMPQARAGLLLNISRLSTVVLAAPLLLIAAQGYSVLYLFLLADLVCAAAGFPYLLRTLQRKLHRTRRDPGDPGRPSGRRSALPGPRHAPRKPA